MKTVALAFSGGLDTCFCAAWLREHREYRVVTVTVDTGGATREDLAEIAARARAIGVVEHREIDARKAVFDGFIATLIRGNVLRGEVYPLSVAAERTQQAIEVANVARAIGADAVAHGSTGAGNDQVRFDVAFRVLLPSVSIVTPIRELGLTRARAIAYLEERGLPVPSGARRYSVNRGLWGTTLGGAWTHDPWAAPPEDAWPRDERSPQGARDVVITWEDGLPVALDGETLSGPELVERLGERTLAYRIGRGIHLGETVLGIKGRIGFEAGAALVLIAAHRELEKLVLTRWQSFWKDHLARFWGDRLHEGQAFDPVMRDIEALISHSQRRVCGETRVRLELGHFQVTGVRSPYGLIDPDVATYGEENALWSGDERAPSRNSLRFRALAARRHMRPSSAAPSPAMPRGSMPPTIPAKREPWRFDVS
ncbi:MAG: argininosuccinate synthase [Acidobacteria bacterium]|nr:argininosuccinate synthase [Acidobacteriota bacterium]